MFEKMRIQQLITINLQIFPENIGCVFYIQKLGLFMLLAFITFRAKTNGYIRCF